MTIYKFNKILFIDIYFYIIWLVDILVFMKDRIIVLVLIKERNSSLLRDKKFGRFIIII